jgi:hypothetical protein
MNQKFLAEIYVCINELCFFSFLSYAASDCRVIQKGCGRKLSWPI